MDTFFKNLDFQLTYWMRPKEAVGSLLPLECYGWMPDKRHRVRQAFGTLNFSLILRGRGSWISKSGRVALEAPFVLIQEPGLFMDYGPEEGESWSEIYLVYCKSSRLALRRSGLLEPGRMFWAMGNPAGVGAALAELEACAASGEPAARIDRIAERIILETWLRPPHPLSDGSPIHRVMEDIQHNWRKTPEWEEMARKHGMSVSTLKRRWSEVCDMPPAKFVMARRLREACRLLVETNRSVFDIAEECGFEDGFYFSRAFRRGRGMSPRAYRNSARMHLAEK